MIAQIFVTLALLLVNSKKAHINELYIIISLGLLFEPEPLRGSTEQTDTNVSADCQNIVLEPH
jgi:hypothetical protein